MLTRLSVDNYVLIDSLEINFSEGMTIITGETGAGKSILLGALSLILGHRAEFGVIRDTLRNCVVEASFDVTNRSDIALLFSENELEYEQEVVIRRVITPSGKSRAFVNDAPTGLPFLRRIGERLIDIHAQHENLLLRQSDFQLLLIDGFAGIDGLRSEYQSALAYYHDCVLRRDNHKKALDKGADEQEYQRFQWEQLTAARLREGEQEELEEEQVTLMHSEEIKGALCGAIHLLQDQEGAALSSLRDVKTLIEKIVLIFPSVKELYKRLESIRIELKDVCAEVEKKISLIKSNPQRLDEVTLRLDTLYALQKKHKCNSVEALIATCNSLSSNFKGMEDVYDALVICEKEVQEAYNKVMLCATHLSVARKSALYRMEREAEGKLKLLGIPHATLLLRISKIDDLKVMGIDEPEFLFSANKDVEPGVLAQIASGGELSRIMLCMKSLMVQSSRLPTIIFDEIDLGVSGRIANKMGEVLQEMSSKMQVIAITHLPQIASKGTAHLVVYKEDGERGSRTFLKRLSSEERVMEIARLLSGSEVTEAAVSNARALLV